MAWPKFQVQRLTSQNNNSLFLTHKRTQMRREAGHKELQKIKYESLFLRKKNCAKENELKQILEAIGTASKLWRQETQVLCRLDGQFGLVVVAKVTGKTPERAGLTREKGAKLNLKAAFKNLQERVAMSMNKRSHDDHYFRYGACSTACCSSQRVLGCIYMYYTCF